MVMTAADLYAKSFFPMEVPFFGETITLTLRRLDVETVLWEGVITQEMADAADRFLALQQMLQSEGTDIEVGRKVLTSMTEREKRLVMEFLARFVCAKVVEPRLTLSEPPEEGAFPVLKLPLPTQVAIFAAMPPSPSGPELRAMPHVARPHTMAPLAETPADSPTTVEAPQATPAPEVITV